ncbi:MAG: DUF3656 domain-containing protein, partial [Clostridia bacterium]|nr:DUF3656 domain-containing protein [Clostridia bacterium]
FTEEIGRTMFGIRTKEDVVSANSAFPTLHSLYRNELQRIPLFGKVEIKTGKPISLTLSDGKNTVFTDGTVPSAAKNRPTDKESINKGLSKLGGTPYFINELEIYIDDNLYVSAADLNQLRRQALELLSQERAKPPIYEIKDTAPQKQAYNNVALTPRLIARFENYGQIPKDLTGIHAIMLPLENTLPDNLPKDIELIADIPRGILNESYILQRLTLFAKKGFKYAFCGNIAAIPLALNAGLKVIGGTGLNIANSQSLNVLTQMGAASVTLSPEITINEALNISSTVPKGIFAYGRLPLMLMRNCPIKNGMTCEECNRSKNLTDRKGIEFPIRCRAGFSEMLNSQPLWLADRLAGTAGLDFLILYFTDESPEDISNIIDMYKNSGAFNGSYTRGLYYRSLQ